MAAVNRNMFDATVTFDRPNERSLMVLPLNLIASIISHLDDPGDLARLCRTCRVLNYMSLPQLYRNMTLTSYDRIRYRGDQPEGMGSASPFSMGLNAVITRPFASLVRSLTLRGDWREHELEEHARVGRVPDSSMMLNIAVRAAVDRMTGLESFSWELNTKMLETVYLGLAQLPRLQSLTVRFPSSRHPRPTTVIPAMPHLRYLKFTDIDPLCYPDDISTLLFKARKLRTLKMHWSPRMRNAQEPSVMLHGYFRKCIAARQPLSVRQIGLQNLYALHNEEFNLAFNQETVEDVTILTNTGSESHNFLNTFVDSTWPVAPPTQHFRIKSIRQDSTSRRHADFLGNFTGLEKLYFVNATPNPADNINCPRQIASNASILTPPPTSEQSLTRTNGAAAHSLDTPPSNSPGLHAGIRDNYLNNIIGNHSATLRHLLLPAHWPLSAPTIARLVHASPQLEQLAFAGEFASMDALALLIPFLRKLKALRLLVPTGPASSPTDHPKSTTGHHHPPKPGVHRDEFATARSLSDIVELDDHILEYKLSEWLADEQVFGQLEMIGLGRKAFQLGDYYTVPAEEGDEARVESQSQSHTPVGGQPATNGVQDIPSTSPSETWEESGPTEDHKSNPNPNPAAGRRVASSSSLGKRTRDDEVVSYSYGYGEGDAPSHGDNNSQNYTNHASEFCVSKRNREGRVWKRRMKRVGWDVLKNWEIWGLDTLEL